MNEPLCIPVEVHLRDRLSEEEDDENYIMFYLTLSDLRALQFAMRHHPGQPVELDDGENVFVIPLSSVLFVSYRKKEWNAAVDEELAAEAKRR